jgi:hypothetical protein
MSLWDGTKHPCFWVSGENMTSIGLNALSNLIDSVDEKFKGIEPEKVNAAVKSLSMTVEEFVSFQNLKTLAQLKGVISLETAQFIYNALGHWEQQTPGTKLILTKLHADLLKGHMQHQF